MTRQRRARPVPSCATVWQAMLLCPDCRHNLKKWWTRREAACIHWRARDTRGSLLHCRWSRPASLRSVGRSCAAVLRTGHSSIARARGMDQAFPAHRPSCWRRKWGMATIAAPGHDGQVVLDTPRSDAGRSSRHGVQVIPPGERAALNLMVERKCVEPGRRGEIWMRMLVPMADSGIVKGHPGREAGA